ncbi:hypothetical protein Goshw_023947 [Gossypium schwendimanii]|uniref:Beta-Casp domain-containing protein n=1 Tax=Gossypium schwendimanii TaxID=34291 RepID=A0A7J9MYW2_GOSSC|nr:hypothetical protein [Gossypium schwendimanii]
MLSVSGFRILLDCPLDLSSLAIFSPVPIALEAHESLETDSVVRKKQKIEKTLDANDLVCAEPWYKTVKSLHLWDASFIDVILISSPTGMLGLPFLTRTKDFSAKIYVTEAAARIGQLMMEDLVSMHMELRQFYGPEDSSSLQWMRWEGLEVLPSELKKIALGTDCEELGAWMPLYSAVDVKDCMRKVQTLKYAEEACYNGTLVIKALSSGLEIGTCNWTINGPKRNIAYISSSIFVSTHAMDFNFLGLQGNDLIIFSDFSTLDTTENIENDNTYCDPVTSSNARSIEVKSMHHVCSDDLYNLEEIAASLLKDDESMEEMEKLAFICTCAFDSVRAGGSVLVPIDRLGIVLCLLEQMSLLLESSSLKVPIYIISSVAEELLAFTNIIPEWLCKQRQEKLFSGEPLFAHVKLIKERKIHVFPAVHSVELLTNWQEPCVVFCPHWSLRLGPVVHLLRYWCSDPNSLLILEGGDDANLALLPFKPMAMKVLQCSFLSGISLQKVQPLLKALQPKLLLFPKDLRCKIQISEVNTIIHYSENETLCMPSSKESTEIDIATDLASQFHWKTLKQETVTRLDGELFMDQGKHRLLSGFRQSDSKQHRPLLHWGSPDLKRLLTELSKMGITGTLKKNMDSAESKNAAGIIDIDDPEKALIDVRETGTVIITADENLASHIFKAIDIVLDGI